MGLLTPYFVPKGRVFVHNDCPGGGVLLPSSRIPGVSPGGMVMDEIDTCITMGDRWRLPKVWSIAGTSSETNFIDDDSDEMSELNPVI